MTKQQGIGVGAAVVLAVVVLFSLFGGNTANGDEAKVRAAIVESWPGATVSSVTLDGNVATVEAQADINGASRPISAVVEKQPAGWQVAAWRDTSEPVAPEPATVVGYWECLPHKGNPEVVTMECAFGIAVDQSDGHYGVNTSLMSTYPVDFPTGQKVRITGRIQPAPMESKYDIDGVVWATNIEKI